MRRTRLALLLDWLALILVVSALGVAIGGGFTTRVGGVRVSARNPTRPLAAALAIMAVRIVLDRRTRPLGGAPAALWQRRARLISRTADPEPTTSPLTRGRHTVAAALGICAFGAGMLYPQLQRMDSVPDLGDPLLSMWRVGWVNRQLLGDPRPLFDANIFHPERLTLAYSDAMLLPALTTAPLLWAGVHPVHAYNLVFLVSFLLSGLAAYLLVIRLTGSVPAAFVSGLLFGFYPYRFEHYSHFELQMTYWMPLALLALHRFVASLRLRDAVLTACCLVAQLYSSMYYGVFLSLFLAVVFLLFVLLLRLDLRRAAAPLAIAGLAVALLAVPLARPYLAAQAIKGVRDVPEVEGYSAVPSDYLRAHPRSATWSDRMLPEPQPERALFPGMVPLVLSAIALVPPLGITRVAYAGGLLFAYDGSLGFNGVTYPYLYEWLVPIRGLRVPARFSIVVGLALAILAGFGMTRLLAGASTRRLAVTTGVLIAAIAIDFRPSLPLDRVWLNPPPVYESIAGAPGIVLAEFPTGGNFRGYTDNAPFMYFSLWHGAQMVNGYSGFHPPGYSELLEQIRSFPDAGAVDALARRGVTHVTINCALYEPPDACTAVLDAIDGSPRFRLVSRGVWRGSPVTLYQLAR